MQVNVHKHAGVKVVAEDAIDERFLSFQISVCQNLMVDFRCSSITPAKFGAVYTRKGVHTYID